MRTTTFAIDEKQLTKIKKIANSKNKTFSEYMRLLVERNVSAHERTVLRRKERASG